MRDFLQIAFLLQKGMRILSSWVENKLNGTAVGRGKGFRLCMWKSV